MTHFFELLKQFVKTDFKIKYKGSYIGILWVVIKPLASFTIIYTVWGQLFNAEPNYKLDLLLGIVFMGFYAEMMMMGLGALLSKSYITLKVNFPKNIALLSASIIAVINFLINMGVFFVLSLDSSLTYSFAGISLFLLSVIDLYLIGLGASAILSVLYIKFRDLLNLVDLSNQLFFWLTPVYYPISILPQRIQDLEVYNPLAQIIGAARKGLISQETITITDFYPVLILFAISLVVLILGMRFFNSQAARVAEYY